MLQTTIDINVDFYDKKHILINAKQLDRDSRFLSITCYNHGELYSLNNGEHAAYVRYRKADNYGVFNNCDINNKGKIIVKLTEQMLAADGICYADLVIVNKGEAEVNPNTGEINKLIANASVLSTMTFCIDVSEVPVGNSDIESTHEFILLNDTLEKYWADFETVMKTSKSWAVGGTGIKGREDENTNNSKYWATQSKNSASAANTSALNAAESERIAGEHKDTAIIHSGNAYTYMTDAKNSMDNAEKYMNNAEEYMDIANDSKSKTEEYMNIAKSHMDNAEYSKTTAESYMDNAKEYMDNAAASALNAADSEENAAASALNAADSEENVSTYYQRIQSIVNGLETGFIPMGTISFSELATVERTIGCVYNIRDDFTTNENFAEGSGMSYTAGTNVYVRSDGLFDCFGGSSPVTATVNEVKQYLNINQ